MFAIFGYFDHELEYYHAKYYNRLPTKVFPFVPSNFSGKKLVYIDI